jgi:hypothetical protein
MAAPEGSSKCICRVVPKSQRRIRRHGDEVFAILLHDQTIVGQRRKSGRRKRCGERRFPQSRFARKRHSFVFNHDRGRVKSTPVFSAGDQGQDLIKQQVTDGPHLRSLANMTGQHALPGGPVEVCEPAKTEDVSVGFPSNPEPRPMSRRSPGVNPLTGSPVHGSTRPFQVERRALMGTQRQLREASGARQNHFAPRILVPFSGTTGAHVNWNNG